MFGRLALAHSSKTAPITITVSASENFRFRCAGKWRKRASANWRKCWTRTANRCKPSTASRSPAFTTVLEKIRAGETLTEKEKFVHDRGLVSTLKSLHDDLDAAVSAAYGRPAGLTDAEILERLVALNAERAAEEARGVIHWLRPEYQAKGQQEIKTTESIKVKSSKAKPAPAKRKGKAGYVLCNSSSR